MAVSPSDPRTIVTPDAFRVEDHLLGFPLSSPSRRLAAIAVDGVFIGILTLLPGFLLGLVGAALFLRIWRKSDKEKTEDDPLARAFKWTMGCFGVFILVITLTAVVGAVGIFMGGRDEDVARVVEEALEGQGAPNPEDLGLRPPEAAPPGDTVPPPEAALPSALPDPESQGMDASLAEYRDLLARDSLVAAEASRARELRRYLAGELAGDSLRLLERRVAALDDELDDTRDDLRDTERALEAEREGSGFVNFLAGIADNLGLTFGWGSVYLTIFLTWWQGQTPGKRLLNIRVLRLDGEPITWFVAFERAGGYAAGVATGLLGFAQVYWDSNRQAIHDKIVGTVVIRDGVDRVTGPWLAPDRGPPRGPVRHRPPTRPTGASPSRPGARPPSRPGGPPSTEGSTPEGGSQP